MPTAPVSVQNAVPKSQRDQCPPARRSATYHRQHVSLMTSLAFHLCCHQSVNCDSASRARHFSPYPVRSEISDAARHTLTSPESTSPSNDTQTHTVTSPGEHDVREGPGLHRENKRTVRDDHFPRLKQKEKKGVRVVYRPCREVPERERGSRSRYLLYTY